MDFDRRLSRLESVRWVSTAEWLRSLSDAELEAIVDDELKRLSDEELERIVREEQ